MLFVAILMKWLEKHLLNEGLALNIQTSKVLLPEGIGTESL